MIEENPILKMNVKLLKFWGLILQPSWRTPVGFIFVAWLNIQMFADLYFTWGDFQTTIMNAYFGVLFFNAVIRAITMLASRRKMQDFLQGLDDCYLDIQRNGSGKAKEILEFRTNRANLITKFNLFMGCFSTLCFFTYPLFTSTSENRTHVYGVWLPFNVDKNKTPYYEIIYVMQMMVTFPSFCMYIPVSNLLATYMIFGIAQLEILRHYLITLKDERDANEVDKGDCNIDNRLGGDEVVVANVTEGWNCRDDKVYDRLKHCIQIHQKINQYVNDMNSLVKYVMFLEFLSFMIMLCALLFLLNIVNQLTQILMVGCYISMILVQVFVFYWHANELTLQSLAIANAVYFSPWYNFDKITKKSVQILMMRAQRPLQVSVGNIYPMGLEMFQTILNTAYTYFTILRRVYD